jgi:serine/threonine protein kinase
MEYCDSGSLHQAIRRGVFHRTAADGRQSVDMEAVCRTLLDIAAGMEYLHHMRIFMKDLKPKNVLLASSSVGHMALLQSASLVAVHVGRRI